VVHGYKNREIAHRLDIPLQSVNNCIRRIFDKTGVSDRLELAIFVLHHESLASAAKDGMRPNSELFPLRWADVDLEARAECPHGVIHVRQEEVEALVRSQSAAKPDALNHGITLKGALITPRSVSVIARDVRKGRVTDEEITVWLVGQEKRRYGYKIILRDDGLRFGLASKGFPHDSAPVLVGWYGDLLNTFLGM